MPARRWRIGVAVLLAACLGVHGALLFQYRDDPFHLTPVADALSYDQWATRIATHGLDDEPAFHQSPLYPLLLALIYRVARYDLAALAFQALLHCAAIAALVPLGRRLFASETAGLAAGWIALLYAPFAFHATKLLPVTLAAASQVAGLLLLVQARDDPRPVRAASAGLVWGLACLARSEMLLFLPLGGLALYWSPVTASASRGARLRPVVLFSIAAIVAISPATAHNLRRSAPVLIASSAGENLYIGNQLAADGGHVPLHPQAGDLFSQRSLARLIAEREIGRSLDPAGVSSYWRGRAFREIRERSFSWLGLEWLKLRRIFSPGDPTDLYSLPLERGRYLSVLRLLPLPTAVLWILAMIGGWHAVRRSFDRVWPLLALAGVHIVVLLAFFVSTRLRLPLLFSVTPLAGLAIAEAVRKWRERERRAVLASVGLALLAIVVHQSVTGDPPEREVLRLASVLSRQDRLEESLEVLSTLTSGANPDPLALDQTGWVRSKRGELEQARAAYEQALAIGLDPAREAQCRSRLAGVLERLGRFDLAGREHDRAVAAAPESAGARFERGLYRVRRGDRAGAIADLRDAAALAPEWAEPREALGRLEGR